nr:DUF1906 domain-containing protein [Gordonia zhaorongruii]
MIGGSSELPSSGPRDPRLGTLLDYSAGVPSASAVRAAGHAGAIRYVSDPRPGAEWMAGKPLREAEAADFRQHGLVMVSCYQFGTAQTADWLGGFPAGVDHARRAVAIHDAAGGPRSAPIYASIDDNPTAQQFVTQIVPFLLGWQSVIGRRRLGVYANAPTIHRANAIGLADWYWQHRWGTPDDYVHPAAHLRQLRGSTRVGGVNVDVNTILKREYGAWA